VQGLLNDSKEYFSKLQAKRKQGVPVVGYIPNGYLPVELIRACGAEPLALFQGGEASPVLAATPCLGRFLDPFSRAQIGYRLENKSPPYQMIDRLIVPMTDQHARGIADAWHFYTDVEVFELGVPKAKTPQALDYYFEGLLRLKSFLETLTGTEITDQRLQTAVAKSNRVRELLKKISLLRTANPPLIGGKEFIQLMHQSYYMDEDFLIRSLEEVFKQRKDLAVTDSSKSRILLVGATLAHGDYRVVDLLEQAGASVVMEHFSEGMSGYWRTLEVKDDPISDVARYYLMEKEPGAFFRDATKERFSFFKDLIDAFNVDGVVWYSLMFRETYDIEQYLFSQAPGLKDLPLLSLKSNYDAGETGALRTRIETFVTNIKRG